MSKISIKCGYNFCCGVVLFFIIAAISGWAVERVWPSDFDDSDLAPLRSGLRIKTDYLTMCQYFVTFTGSITPRLGRDGKQICK